VAEPRVAFDADRAKADPGSATATVQPGIALDALNAFLSRTGLWFPVDVSTSAQATLGGMAGNNSCGSRSIAYGNMVHNVVADRRDPRRRHRGLVGDLHARRRLGGRHGCRAARARDRRRLHAIADRERDEIAARGRR
jgi:FAD/FMN-containing dehydrogenase